MSRGNTRQRIQDVALELFAEQGYEKTSLREIAEQLDVTKAALYYHFKTKEDIVISLFQDLARPARRADRLGRGAAPHAGDEAGDAAPLQRGPGQAAPLFRFMQENQATVRELSIGESFKDRMLALFALIQDSGRRADRSGRCSVRAVHHARGDVRAAGHRGRPRGEAQGRPRGRPGTADHGTPGQRELTRRAARAADGPGRATRRPVARTGAYRKRARPGGRALSDAALASGRGGRAVPSRPDAERAHRALGGPTAEP